MRICYLLNKIEVDFAFVFPIVFMDFPPFCQNFFFFKFGFCQSSATKFNKSTYLISTINVYLFVFSRAGV